MRLIVQISMSKFILKQIILLLLLAAAIIKEAVRGKDPIMDSPEQPEYAQR